MEFCSSGSIAKILKVLNKIEEPQIAAISYHVLSGKCGGKGKASWPFITLFIYFIYLYIYSL